MKNDSVAFLVGPLVIIYQLIIGFQSISNIVELIVQFSKFFQLEFEIMIFVMVIQY